MSFIYIAGDIGGTNARIELYSSPESGDDQLLAKETYHSPDYADLSAVVKHFFSEHQIDQVPRTACFSVAGPVKDGKVNLTNLGWEISEKEMETELGIERVIFLNDFAACGYGIKLIKPEELFELTNSKTPIKNGPKIIIGAGTGLGEAYMFEQDDEFSVVSGEGGHTDFAAKNKVEFDLMLYIKRTLNLSRVGVERVVSGPGLESIYNFFCHQESLNENPAVSAQVRGADSPGEIISKFAIEKADILCEKALHLFISCFGAEAGNMALNVLPAGGVYIAGGIAPKIRDVIKDDFLESFYDKGRMRRLLCSYPIYVVMNPSVGILGARYISKVRTSSLLGAEMKRSLSVADIASHAETVQLLSEEPAQFVLDTPTAPARSLLQTRPRAGSLQQGIGDNSWREGSPLAVSSTANNVLWMASGVALSGLLLASFLLGKSKRN